jgi:hypothetical protein
MKKYALWAVPVLSVLLIVFGVNIQPNDSNTATKEAPPQSVSQVVLNDDGTIVSYQGQDGTTALELLKQNANAITEDSSFGEFVSAINGVGDSSDDSYWLYYVNGEPAQVGAGDYVTSNTDVIEWRYE